MTGMHGVEHILPLIPALASLIGGAMPSQPKSQKTSPFVREKIGTDLLAASWTDYFAVDAKNIRALPAEWDGPASVAIAEATLLSMQHLLGRALASVRNAIAPRVVPAGDGSVQAEWHEEHGELEFSISADGELCVWARDHLNEIEFEGFGAKALSILYAWAPWVATSRHHVGNASVPATATILQIAA